MRQLLKTLICILLTSPLAAFETGLPVKGFEYGVLQMNSQEQTWTDGMEFLSAELVLNQGDVLYVLRFDSTPRYSISYQDEINGFGTYNQNALIYSTSGLVTTTVSSNQPYIVGPATVQIGFRFPTQNNMNAQYYLNYEASMFAQMDYAILRANTSTQSSYVTIPANPSGNFEVKLQTSSDLQTWSPTTPGIFPYGDNAKFFRLVVE